MLQVFLNTQRQQMHSFSGLNVKQLLLEEGQLLKPTQASNLGTQRAHLSFRLQRKENLALLLGMKPEQKCWKSIVMLCWTLYSLDVHRFLPFKDPWLCTCILGESSPN